MVPILVWYCVAFPKVLTAELQLRDHYMTDTSKAIPVTYLRGL
jgi:hypothetical protein